MNDIKVIYRSRETGLLQLPHRRYDCSITAKGVGRPFNFNYRGVSCSFIEQRVRMIESLGLEIKDIFTFPSEAEN